MCHATPIKTKQGKTNFIYIFMCFKIKKNMFLSTEPLAANKHRVCNAKHHRKDQAKLGKFGWQSYKISWIPDWRTFKQKKEIGRTFEPVGKCFLSVVLHVALQVVVHVILQSAYRQHPRGPYLFIHYSFIHGYQFFDQF